MKLRTPPLLTGSQLERLNAECLVTEATFEAVLVEQEEVGGLQARNMSFDESLLKQVVAVSARLEKLSLRDSHMHHCDLSGAICSEAAWLRVALDRCRLSGIDVSQAVLQDISFNGCRLDMANFRFAKLNRIRFVDCDFTEADFMGAHLKDVNFENCKLHKTVFEQCQFKTVDFRGSEILDLRGWQALQGCSIDSVQLMAVAPELAAALGLRVVD